jgi:hypothetical protein
VQKGDRKWNLFTKQCKNLKSLLSKLKKVENGAT